MIWIGIIGLILLFGILANLSAIYNEQKRANEKIDSIVFYLNDIKYDIDKINIWLQHR